jgi:hypothetical protein
MASLRLVPDSRVAVEAITRCHALRECHASRRRARWTPEAKSTADAGVVGAVGDPQGHGAHLILTAHGSPVSYSLPAAYASSK